MATVNFFTVFRTWTCCLCLPKCVCCVCTGVCVSIEQVLEANSRIAITVDGQLSWSSHIDKVFVKMGKGMSVIKIFVF